ncbi:MAG TPA: UDP-N-acetylglucosamine 2-epimerase (non-hydrolyzing) [Methylomirabilota bacterium]|nr:UDP-N-acetylglucosamine 2-epimerase (non-hydrolyzing) [Methylomirabilota bacterium]
MRILAVVGARPNFVKIAPIMAELAEYPYVSTTLVHTGQHYDAQMSDSFFTNLEIPRPNVNLKVQSSGAVAQIAEIMIRIEPVIETTRPDVVVVVGDVNSTVAATLAAVKTGCPVAHVEAGLRSFDRSMPEEMNRVLTDSVSDLLFTTEPAAEANLAREGVASKKIHFVGNVMIDTLFRYRERARESEVLERLGLEAGRYAALTLHRPSNVDDEGTLGMLLGAIARIQTEIPVVFPVHPRTRRRLEALSSILPAMPQLRLADPMPYLDFVHLMGESRCVLTDSGGIQEETTALGIPCLTLRQNTERPITVTRGTNRIVGIEPDDIFAGWRDVAEGRWPSGELPELWDGKAAGRIVRVLLEHAR